MNKWGESLLWFVFAAYLWSTFTVVSKITGFNPLLIDIRGHYAQLRGIER
jgi:hypothetical protein